MPPLGFLRYLLSKLIRRVQFLNSNLRDEHWEDEMRLQTCNRVVVHVYFTSLELSFCLDSCTVVEWGLDLSLIWLHNKQKHAGERLGEGQHTKNLLSKSHLYFSLTMYLYEKINQRRRWWKLWSLIVQPCIWRSHSQLALWHCPFVVNCTTNGTSCLTGTNLSCFFWFGYVYEVSSVTCSFPIPSTNF